jgi:hypothetical protein
MSVDLVSKEELERLCPGISEEYDDTETVEIVVTGMGEPIALTFNSKQQVMDLIKQLLELLDDRAELGVIVKGQVTTIGEMALAESLSQSELLVSGTKARGVESSIG